MLSASQRRIRKQSRTFKKISIIKDSRRKKDMIEIGTDFSGVGAFEQALIRMGINHKTVFACDQDKYARKTYELNFGIPDYFPKDVYNRVIPEKPLDIYVT